MEYNMLKISWMKYTVSVENSRINRGPPFRNSISLRHICRAICMWMRLKRGYLHWHVHKYWNTRRYIIYVHILQISYLNIHLIGCSKLESRSGCYNNNGMTLGSLHIVDESHIALETNTRQNQLKMTEILDFCLLLIFIIKHLNT